MGASEIKPMLVELYGLLAANKTEARDLTESVSRHLISWDADQEVRRLQTQVGRFDFENARKTLEEIAEMIGAPLSSS